MASGDLCVSGGRKPFSEGRRGRGRSSAGWLTPATLALVAAAGNFLTVATLQAAVRPTKEAPLPVVVYGDGQAAAATRGGEKPVLALLAAGYQLEAEALLKQQIGQFPEAQHLVRLVMDEKFEEADQFSSANRDKIRAAQRTLFLLAACARTRFDVKQTTPIFHVVYATDRSLPYAQCAWLVKRLDSDKMKWASKQIQDDAFADFKKLADENPDDVFIHWMLAVECRTWERNEEGVEQYQQILKQWNPGPALVHQTYANLLDELGRFDEALVERCKAVKMEPASWTYDGLGNTLKGLGRFDEANEAYITALGMEPICLRYWIHWANGRLGAAKIPFHFDFVNVFVFAACAGVGGSMFMRKLLGRRDRTKPTISGLGLGPAANARKACRHG
ncbi:MAG TPA: tetratricopeptide repeat protein [Pirellulales bacterium]|jgi:tetratricopeptide (TPR) repeat protein|nr:tetratricopeptide repeat protein [Pirellulales bacterium]